MPKNKKKNKNKNKYSLKALLIVSVITIGLFLMPSKIKVENGISKDFFALPAVHLGRVKPLDTIARTSLISYKGRSYKEGKKISFIDGIDAIFALIKYKIFKNL